MVLPYFKNNEKIFKKINMDIKDCAKVLIKNKKLGKYLFVLRDNIPTILHPNMYGLLGGGIEVGETPLEALKRELMEESNIQVFNIKELGNNIISNNIKEGAENKIIKNTFFIFSAETNNTLAELKIYEGQRLNYFTIEEALGLSNLTTGTRESIHLFKKEL